MMNYRKETINVFTIACAVGILLFGFLFASSKAHAIGDTEAGILYGLGIYKVWDIMNEEDPWEPGQSREYGNSFPPFSCKGSGIDCAYQRGVYEREKEEWEDAREKAYECGRYGRNCES